MDANSKSNNLISNPHHYATPKARETLIQKQVLIPTVTAFATCSWPFSSANELEILLPNTTSEFDFKFTSATCSQKFWTGALIGHLTWHVERHNTYLHYPWKKPKNRRLFRTRSRIAAASCFRVRFSN